MAPRSLLWPDPRVKPPFGAAEVDWAHPLAAGLMCFLPFNDGGNAITDLVRGTRFSRQGNVSWQPRAIGLSANFPGATGDYFNAPSSDQFNASTRLSVGVWLRSTTVNRSQLLTKDTNTGRSWGLVMEVSANSISFSVFKTGGTETVLTASSTPVNNGAWRQVVGTYRFVTDGTSVLTLYRDGVSAATRTDAVGQILSTATEVEVGRRLYPGFLDPFTGDIGLAFIYFRELLVQDVLWLYNEPYAMLRPIVRRRYFVPAAAPPATPLHGKSQGLVMTHFNPSYR